ncbi:MAG TPA: hypothetical protein VGE26_05865 [Sphingobacteriaceae bacterium]
MKYTITGSFPELEEREKEVRTAVFRAVKKLTGYKPAADDISIEFTFSGAPVIEADLKITTINGALQLLESLHTEEHKFMAKLAEQISACLFEYLVFNNRIASIADYSQDYKNIRMTITDYMLGAKVQHQFSVS